MLRSCLFAALLCATSLAQATTLSLDAPAVVPVDGSPFDVDVLVAGLGPGHQELKVWLGGPDWQASRTWGDEGWTRADHYAVVVTPDDQGRWEGHVSVRANPDATHHARLTSAEVATLGARLRDGAATSTTLVNVSIERAPALAWVTLGPGERATATAGELAWSATQRGTARAPVQVALPDANATLCTPTGCGPGALRLEAIGRRLAVITNRETTTVDLAASVLVAHGRACTLDGRIGPMGARTFVLETLPCAPAPGHPDALHARGTVDPAPDPPGLGWAVRIAESGTWAPWRLPEGTWSTAPERQRVIGHVHPFETAVDGLRTVVDVIEGARHRLTLATYQLTNEPVVDALIAASQRGVLVRVVLEPTPVGGLPKDTAALVQRLVDHGVVVDNATGPAQTHGLQHAKLVIADGAVALVLTENLTNSGLPPRGEGNRGWGIGLANVTLARRLEALFGPSGPSAPWTPPGWRAFDANVTIIAAPEHAWRPDAVPRWLASSEGPIDVAVLRATPRWAERPNAWLEALVNASQRTPVRLLVNGADAWADQANALALAHAQVHPARGTLDARASARSLGTLHGKLVVTSEAVLIGSSNWGLGGALLNREVNVLVEDASLAAWYRVSFDRLWQPEPVVRTVAFETSAWLIGVLVAGALGNRAGHRRGRAVSRPAREDRSGSQTDGVIGEFADEAQARRTRGSSGHEERDDQECQEPPNAGAERVHASVHDTSSPLART